MSEVLVDGDLTLRRAVPADAADIAEVYSEADIRHWMLWDDELPTRPRRWPTSSGPSRPGRRARGRSFRIVVDGQSSAGRTSLPAGLGAWPRHGDARAAPRDRLGLPRARPGRGCSCAATRRTPLEGAGRAGGVRLRGTRAPFRGAPRRPPPRLPRLLDAARRAGRDPGGDPRRRGVPDRHGDHGHRGAGALPRRRRPRGVQGRLPRLDSRAAARGSQTAPPRSSRRTASTSVVCASCGPRARRAGRPPAAAGPPGQGIGTGSSAT